MDVFNKDINLLYLFKVLYEEKNLSQAANRMALTQPTLSHKLNKLRKEFNDELFVRAARGVTPTPLAHEIAGQVGKVVCAIEHLYQDVEQTPFLQRAETIRIYTTDFVEQILLPCLLPIVVEHAPNIKIVTYNTKGTFPKRELEDGGCDIAIAGFYHDLPDTFYQQSIREERFVVLANSENHLLKVANEADSLSIDDYLACPHIMTTLTGDLIGIVDKALQQQGLNRNLVAGISSFTAPAMVVKKTDFLFTCLNSIAREAKSNYANLRIWDCPIDIPQVQITQCWHQRTHADPLRQWLRQHIEEIMRHKVCVQGE